MYIYVVRRRGNLSCYSLIRGSCNEHWCNGRNREGSKIRFFVL